MPLPASGAISFDNLQTEFGNTNPIPISDYYRGALVPNITVNNSVPTSGQISMSNFYSAAQADYVPAAFDFADIGLTGESYVEANTSVTITGINTPITLTFLTNNASIQYVANFGSGSATINTKIYINGIQQGTTISEYVFSASGPNGYVSGFRSQKITVSNNDVVTVNYSVAVTGESGDGGGTSTPTSWTVSNDSNANTVLSTFTLSGSINNA